MSTVIRIETINLIQRRGPIPRTTPTCTTQAKVFIWLSWTSAFDLSISSSLCCLYFILNQMFQMKLDLRIRLRTEESWPATNRLWRESRMKLVQRTWRSFIWWNAGTSKYNSIIWKLENKNRFPRPDSHL